MSSFADQPSMSTEEEDFLRVMQLPSGMILNMVLKAAIELDVFGVMAKADPGSQLSAAEIATQLPTGNPEAPFMVDRMLRFLASFSYLKCTLVADENGHAERFYSLEPICKYFLQNQDETSLASYLLLILDKVLLQSWNHLGDAVVGGDAPFIRAHGMHCFSYTSKDSRFNEVFNRAMNSHTSLVMKRLLQVYNGFEGVKEVVDVAGGFGATLACIISKYPNIRGVNFDLPHVIQNAPPHPGVEHVCGDMFESVPKAEVILLKWILHDWGDDQCLMLLKNCWKALPESGKAIVVETIVPEKAETDLLSTIAIQTDLSMMMIHPGGKERTEREFEDLAKEAGFASAKLVCRAYSDWVIEFHKN